MATLTLLCGPVMPNVGGALIALTTCWFITSTTVVCSACRAPLESTAGHPVGGGGRGGSGGAGGGGGFRGAGGEGGGDFWYHGGGGDAGDEPLPLPCVESTVFVVPEELPLLPDDDEPAGGVEEEPLPLLPEPLLLAGGGVPLLLLLLLLLPELLPEVGGAGPPPGGPPPGGPPPGGPPCPITAAGLAASSRSSSGRVSSTERITRHALRPMRATPPLRRGILRASGMVLGGFRPAGGRGVGRCW